MNTIVAEAGLADAEAIATLHRQCFTDAWEVETLRRLLREGSIICVVARTRGAGDLAGFVLCRLAADECEVLSCATTPSLRRNGVASGLLAAALAEARRRGARDVFLEVAVNSPAARALYAAFGFLPVGRRPGYYYSPDATAVDALIMHRELQTNGPRPL